MSSTPSPAIGPGESGRATRKIWTTLIGAAVTTVTIIGGALGIWQYWIQTPHHDMSGTWSLKTETDTSQFSEYKGMQLFYTVNLTQDGTHISGKGQKLGEQLPGKQYVEYEPKARTDIDFDGNLDGDSIDANIVDHGKLRDTSGHFHWKLTGKSWEGTFDSEAATSAGKCFLTRAGE